MAEWSRRIIAVNTLKSDEFSQLNHHMSKLKFRVDCCRFRIEKKISGCNFRNNSTEMISTNYLMLF